MKRSLLLTLTFLTLMMLSYAEGVDSRIVKFIGLWEVDYDRTMQVAKEHPRFDGKIGKRLPQMIKRMMASMRIQIKGKEIVYKRGNNSIPLKYKIKSGDERELFLSTKQGSKEIVFTITRVEDKFMSFKSSGTDDMDVYVWKLVTEEDKKEEKEETKKE